ncbi:hypothetical protein [Paracoccus marinaquae]|uniref:AMP-binding enzyme C-terminal domain-containing protein n=1 Tax=Paracoccus marinaquae TaxID=2841926 RepID=A0ABS6AL93_9RHOB|nr:hypothetical protein [Paracoccus marinaquae]MBU3031367.1 hypothetical protein [Paracoccus marinaquae]
MSDQADLGVRAADFEALTPPSFLRRAAEAYAARAAVAWRCRHPDIPLAAVIAAPDPKWGETSWVLWAFAEARAGSTPAPGARDALCGRHLPGFKRPRNSILGPLPKAATGKIQKFVLRDIAREMLDGA